MCRASQTFTLAWDVAILNTVARDNRLTISTPERRLVTFTHRRMLVTYRQSTCRENLYRAIVA